MKKHPFFDEYRRVAWGRQGHSNFSNDDFGFHLFCVVKCFGRQVKGSSLLMIMKSSEQRKSVI